MRSIGAASFPLPAAIATGFHAAAAPSAHGLAGSKASPDTGSGATSESSGMSSREVASLLVAFEPVMGATGANINPRHLEDIISQVAAMRAAGENTVLVIVSVPGGGASVSAMSQQSLSIALQSGGEGLGTVENESGGTDKVADHVRAAIGASSDTQAAGGRLPDSVVAESLASAFGQGRSVKGRGLQPGATVELMPLAARPGAKPPSGSGLLNIVV